jgi:hypothetical protein
VEDIAPINENTNFFLWHDYFCSLPIGPSFLVGSD